MSKIISCEGKSVTLQVTIQLEGSLMEMEERNQFFAKMKKAGFL